MKLSVAIAGENASQSAFVVWRGFEESIRKASEYGYHGVELALKTAEDVNGLQLSRWLETNNMEVSCISTGQVFASLGLYFTHPDKEKRKDVIKIFNGLILLAKDYGKMINIGRSRGYISDDQSREQAERLFIETADIICEEAEKHGVTIIIEPVNRYEINFINSLDDAKDIIEKLNSKNTGLMPDVFHMNIEDDKIGDSLVRNAAYVKYIHLADSNRLAPGWGHIDFDEVFEALDKIGFDQWVAVEILPKPDADTAALQAAGFILPMIKKHNKMRGAYS